MPKPRLPQNVLKLRGSWRAKAREKEGVIDLPVSSPDVPHDISAEALPVYQKLIEILSEMGVLHRADEFALHRYAEKFVRWNRARKNLIGKEEVTTIEIPLKNGDVMTKEIKNPHATAESDLSFELLQLERQFGLTPSARSYLKIGHGPKEKEKEDPKDRFFKQNA